MVTEAAKKHPYVLGTPLLDTFIHGHALLVAVCNTHDKKLNDLRDAVSTLLQDISDGSNHALDVGYVSTLSAVDKQTRARTRRQGERERARERERESGGDTA